MTENKLKGLDIPELKHKKVYTQEYVGKLEGQLEQAKEIIKDLSKYVNDCKWYVQNGYDKLQKELVAKAEQFLKEIEK